MAKFAVGLAANLLLFFASLAVAGMLLAILQGPFDQIAQAGADIATTAEADRGRSMIEQFWDLLPFVVAILGLVQLLGAAIVQGRTP